jgi:hypothetical protein
VILQEKMQTMITVSKIQTKLFAMKNPRLPARWQMLAHKAPST